LSNFTAISSSPLIPFHRRMPVTYWCPNKAICDFHGSGGQLKEHISTSGCKLSSGCKLYYLSFVFLKPDSIWYDKLLDNRADKIMYVYHFCDNYFASFSSVEGRFRVMLENERHLHYLEVQRTKEAFFFEVTTGFEPMYASRLDTVFVLSPNVITEWGGKCDDMNQADYYYCRDTGQFAQRVIGRNSLERFQNVYILLVLKKRDYIHDTGDLFCNSTGN
jgi:hypothetical protein